MPRLKVWGAIALLSLTTLVPPSLAATKKPVAHATRRHAKLPPGILFDCRFVKGNWKLNGLYGPFTRDAVQAFQRANHLFPDGVAGLKTDHALGLKFTRKLRCGMGGHDVYLLQKALLAHGYWYGQHGRPAPTPTPIPSPPLAPSPSVPTSGWQKPPILYTPAPLPTPEPTVPTPKPAPSATPRPLVLAPAPKAVPAPAASPVATIAIGAWAADGLSSLRTAPISLEGEGAVNLGAFELRGDAVAISAPNAPGVTAGSQTSGIHGFYAPLVDLTLGSHVGPNSTAFIGYRGFPLGGLQYGVLGVSVGHTLGVPWLDLNARLDAGLSGAGQTTYNGQATLNLRAGHVLLSLGYRHLIFADSLSSEIVSGPTLQLGLGF